MDIELLKQALENDDNMSIINTNIQELKENKNNVLQKIGLDRNNLKTFNKKLKDYKYIENICDLKYGHIIRWINLNKLENINLNNSALLCDIKILDNGIALVLKTFNYKHITLYFNSNLFFQKISDEEKVLLKAIDLLNKTQ